MQICTRCVMDTTDSEIQFDKDGVCNHCRVAEKRISSIDRSQLFSIVDKIKEDGKGKNWDCIVGLSGGVDSSYMLWKASELGLRCLVVMYDNRWDTVIAKENKESLAIDTAFWVVVAHKKEFYRLQKAFFQASVPDVEIPTDHAITSALYQTAVDNGVKWILTGNNLATEAIRARSWSRGHFDWKYIKSIYYIFTGDYLRRFDHRSKVQDWAYKHTFGIKRFELLNYIPYTLENARDELRIKFRWKKYVGKHCESIITRFVSLYYLPKKFGYDKRKANFSSLIISGAMSRQEALERLAPPAWVYKEMKQDLGEVLSRLRITKQEWSNIMNAPLKSYFDYPHYRFTSDPRKKFDRKYL